VNLLAAENALARRAELMTEVASIDVFLATYHKMIRLTIPPASA
jgi:hypothetical protein